MNGVIILLLLHRSIHLELLDYSQTDRRDRIALLAHSNRCLITWYDIQEIARFGCLQQADTVNVPRGTSPEVPIANDRYDVEGTPTMLVSFFKAIDDEQGYYYVCARRYTAFE